MNKEELIEKMIADTLESFDFDKVHKVMKMLNWKWVSNEIGGDEAIPSTYRLIKRAEELLRKVATVANNKETAISGCGGFVAEMSDGILSLSFILESSTTYDDDYTNDENKTRND